MRLTFLLALLTYGLFAQEQVSDIDNYGSIETTNLDTRLGFAFLDSRQYMIHDDGDDVSIYILESEEFVLIHKLEDLLIYKFLVEADIANESRSKLLIHNGKYIRVSHASIQVIDIITGEVMRDFRTNPTVNRFTNVVKVHDNRIYMWGLDYDLATYLNYDIDKNALFDVPSYLRGVDFQYREDQLVFINQANTGLTSFNIDIRTNNFIFNATEDVFKFKVSPSDNSIRVVDIKGAIYVIDQQNVVTKLACEIDNMNEIKDIHLLKDRAIIIRKYDSTSESKDSVEVLNLLDCSIEQRFVTGDYGFGGAEDATLLDNAEADESFSILAYGRDVIMLIDHKDNSVNTISNSIDIDNYTGVRIDDYIYFTSGRIIYQHDLISKSTRRVSLNDTSTGLSSHLAYPDGDKLIVGTIDIEESVRVFVLDHDRSYQLMNTVKRLERLGFHDIKFVRSHEGKIYVSSYGKVHSVDDDAQFISNNYSRNNSNNGIKDFAYAPGRIGYLTFDETDKMIIYNYNTNAETLDSLEVSDWNVSGLTITAGPLILNEDDGTINYFDVRSQQVGKIDPLEDYFPNSRIFGEVSVGQDEVSFTYRINDTDWTVATLNYNDFEILRFGAFPSGIDLNSGFNNSTYIVNETSNNTTIYFKNELDQINEIYSGEGKDASSYSSKTNYNEPHAEEQRSFVIRKNDNTVVFICHDRNMTYIQELDNDVAHSNIVVEQKGDQFLLRTSQNNKIILWYYKVGNDIVKIHESNEWEYLGFAKFSEDYGAFYLGDYNQNLNFSRIITYRFADGEVSEYDSQDIPHRSFETYKAMHLVENKFLFENYNSYYTNPSTLVGDGSEPWILDLDNNEAYLLKDINPGLENSFPDFFTRLDDYVYFSATLEDNSVQWFRLDENDFMTVAVDELENNQDINIRPNVSSDYVHVDKDFNYLYIVDMKGVVVQHLVDYTSDQPINIVGLATGIYYLIGEDNTKLRGSGKFVKI